MGYFCSTHGDRHLPASGHDLHSTHQPADARLETTPSVPGGVRRRRGGGSLAVGVAAGASTATFTAGANTRLRFVGSNVQCLVYERSDSETVPAGIDCFYDQGSVGQLGAYHANLDALNQVSVGRTFVTGIKIPGGAAKRDWSQPETQGGGEQSVHPPSSSITLRMGETVRIASTRISCLYQRADIVDGGATAVACVNDAGSPAARPAILTTSSASPQPRFPAPIATRSS